MATVDLNKEWAELCREFVDATGYDVEHSDCDAQAIIDKLAKAKTKDDEAKASLVKAQKYVGNTIKVIQQIGGIAATGASMVFGSPANITMNCVNFLIDAGVQYNNITANIESIFAQISSVMQRLQLVIDDQGIMNPAMIRTTHEMLIAIVKVCKLCGMKLKEHGKKWGKVAQFTKLALWSSDGGIKAQLGVLTTLEARELQMKSSVTMVAAEVTKRNVEDIKVTSSQMATEVADLHKRSTADKELEEIKDMLGVDDKISNEEYKNNKDKLSAEACAWLRTDSDYQDWLSFKKHLPSVMILHGDQGFGTSVTLTSMIRDLRELHPQGREDANRTTVAHCYMTRAGTKGSKNQAQASLSIRDALRIWSFQIAKNDLVYRKDIKALLKSDSEFKDLNDMWTKLFANQLSKGAAFYLLLDGLEEFEDSDLDQLAALCKDLTTAPGRLRMVLSCRPRVLKKFQAVKASVAILELREKNRPDLERHIKSKVDELEIFKKPTSETSKLKDFVCNGLLEAVDGNFLLADTKLAEIATKYDPEEIRQLIEDLQESGVNVNDSIDEAIRTCNSTLTIREIEDLNCILRWVIFSEEYLAISELQAILFLENNRSSPMLAKMIQDKFSSLIAVTDSESPYGVVYLKYDSAADHFMELADQRSSETSTSQALTQGEIEVVRHFIEKLCDSNMYERLGLAKFFDQKLNQLGANVAVDCDNAHAMIAQTCLRILIEGTTQETEGLLKYAASNILNHLQKIDTDTVNPVEKAKLGPLLIKLLRDEATITRFTENVWQPLSYMDDALEQIVRLMRGSAIMKGIASSELEIREWRDSVLADDHPELAILKQAATVAANFWLTSQDSSLILRHFHWFNGYRNKLESLNQAVTRMKERPADDELTEENIKSTVAQAQQLLGIDKLDAAALRAIGIVYRESGNLDTAIELFHQALEVDPSFVLAQSALGVAYGKNVKGGSPPNYEKAIYHTDIAIESLRSGKQMFESQSTVDTLNGLLDDKANYLRKLARYREALDIYEDLLREDPTSNYTRRCLVYTLCQAELYSEVVTLFQTLYEEEDGIDTKGSKLSSLFVEHASYSEYHSNVVKAFRKADKLQDMQRHYRWIIEGQTRNLQNGTNDTTADDAYPYLNYYLGVMLHRYGNTAEKIEALTIWEAVIDKARKENDRTWACVFAARDLSNAYIAAAIQHDHESEMAKILLAKLADYLLLKSDGDDDDQWRLGLTPSELRSLLGRYYHKIGQQDEARKQIRPDVELGLELLTDEYTENDYQGYRKLGDAFMDFGDDINARAAWSLIQPYPQEQSIEIVPTKDSGDLSSPDSSPQDDEALAAAASTTSTTNGTSDDTKLVKLQSCRSLSARVAKRTGPLQYSCASGCGTEWTYTDGFYICRVCVDVKFDEACHKKLQKGELDLDICDSNHEFLRVDSASLESEERFKNGQVLVGERLLTLDEWLQEIRRDWDLQVQETAADLMPAVAVESSALA